jgi:hypothetical protein
MSNSKKRRCIVQSGTVVGLRGISSVIMELLVRSWATREWNGWIDAMWKKDVGKRVLDLGTIPTTSGGVCCSVLVSITGKATGDRWQLSNFRRFRSEGKSLWQREKRSIEAVWWESAFAEVATFGTTNTEAAHRVKSKDRDLMKGKSFEGVVLGTRNQLSFQAND